MAKPSTIERKLGNMRVNVPYFADQIEPKGRLLPQPECQACWYYFMLAHQAALGVGSGPESQVIVVDDSLETPLWMEHRYHQIARTVAMIYGLESPDSFLPYAPLVEKEAERIAYEKNQPFEMPYGIWKPFGVGEIGRKPSIIGLQ